MTAVQLHDNEIAIDDDLVKTLIAGQFAEYRQLPLIRAASSGSTNVMYYLGDELMVRLPRQPGSGKAIHKEQRWTSQVGQHLSFAVPEIVGIGAPSAGYPEDWCLLTRLPGEHPEANSDAPLLAGDLASCIQSIQSIPVTSEASDDRTLKNYRGRSLANFDNQMHLNVDACQRLPGFKDTGIDLKLALELWHQGLEAEAAQASEHEAPHACFFHGDLVAENLLVENGRLTGVLDFGGLAIGNPAIELHGAWELFDQNSRDVFRRKLGTDDSTWQIGQAWAIAIALGVFSYYWHTMPDRVRHRLAMLRAALKEGTPG